MNRAAQSILLTVLGAIVIKLAWTDGYLLYVKDWIRWPLLASGALLVVMSFGHLLGGDRGHQDDHRSWAGWLLVLPVAVVLIVSPPPLGSFIAESRANQVAAAPPAVMTPLPAGDPVPLTLGEFVVRSVYDDGRSLAGRNVRLTGFVSRDKQGNWYVTRMAIGCCAADAIPYRVLVRGDSAPTRDTWVEVTGTWDEPPAETQRKATPAVVPASVVEVDQPRHPYE